MAAARIDLLPAVLVRNLHCGIAATAEDLLVYEQSDIVGEVEEAGRPLRCLGHECVGFPMDGGVNTECGLKSRWYNERG